MSTDDLINDLAKVFPADRLLTGDAETMPYESDGLTAFRGRPAAIVLPISQDEVIQAVKLCHKHSVPFMARGSGTSLSGGSVPVPGGLVIALNRMNKILRYDPLQRVAIVEPGVINLRVSEHVAADKLYYAPDPSSGPVCTIGGNVAFNSGGVHCLKYGMTANHVLGLKCVLPDGEVVTLGGDSLESVGPDLTGMFTGCEGLFGIALEITLRLLPKPETYRAFLAAYDSLTAAGDAVSMVVATGLLPGAMEIMDRLAMDAAEAAVKAGYPPEAKAIFLVELEGPAEEVAAEEPRLMKVLDDSGATEIRVARDEAERMKFWKGRKSAFSAVGRLSPDFIVQDGVVPRSRLGEALSEIERLSKQFDIRVANVFHAGDGNLHPLIMYDGRVEGALEHAEKLAGEILRMCIRMGGSITGEHGVGLEKKDYLGEMYEPRDTKCMFAIRDAMDPKNIANRGKMLPDGDAPALTSHGAHPLEKKGIISRV